MESIKNNYKSKEMERKIFKSDKNENLKQNNAKIFSNLFYRKILLDIVVFMDER